MRAAEPDRFEDVWAPQTQPRFLRAREAARHIGIAEKTLANWRSAGKGPRFSRLGRAIVYAREDLDLFVEICLQK